MIRISYTTQTEEQDIAYNFLIGEYKKGTVDKHLDNMNLCFSFYNPEDEMAFILKYGNDLEYKCFTVAGYFFTPYIPLNLTP